MTANVAFRQDWANHAAGKLLRGLIAIGGVVTATFVVLLATIGSNSVWFLLALGLTLGVVAVRAAMRPTVVRLATTLAAVIAIPVASLII